MAADRAGVLLIGWVLAAGGAAARLAALPAAPPAAGARAVPDLRQPGVLAVPDPRHRLHDPRARAADGRGVAGPHRRRRSRHPAGRLGVDAHGATSPATAGSGRCGSCATLGESLAWKDDRMAMALFAHIAAPQVRLTKDPNTFFFFLDHLAQESPFRLEDDTTLGHQHRARHRVGDAADREGHRAVRQVAEREGVRAGHRRPGVERRGGARAEDRPHQRRPGLRRRRRHDRRRLHSRAGAQAERHVAARAADSLVARSRDR